MSSTPHTPLTPASFATELREAHSRSLMRRMLAGEGAVELTAYRAGEALSSAVHGISRFGHLVVADIPNLFHSLGAFHTAGDIDVRVDIVKDSADHSLALRLASLHLLGTLRWCRDTAEVDALGLQGNLADLVHDVGPRVRVGVVSTERILLHDSSGVSAHGTAVLTSASATPRPTDALDDAVLGTAPEVLAGLADAVLDGRLPGWTEKLDIPGDPDFTAEPVHCVDADHHGVTLARFTPGEGWVVQVPLPSLPSDAWAQDSSVAWRRLLASLAPRSLGALRR
jgi:hypothetical protein